MRFVTTSAGDPTKYTAQLKAAGLTVFHVVPTLAAALKAVDAGVDGLVVEGGEGGGFKNPRDVASMVLLPLVASQVDVPIIAAGGIIDGRSMAAAFALGAEGVQMGTRMVSAAESPVHDNWKQAIVDAAETDTVFLNRFSKPGPARAAHRAQRRGSSARTTSAMSEFGTAMDLYFGGDMEASLALGGQVVGRIDAVLPGARGHRLDDRRVPRVRRASPRSPTSTIVDGARRPLASSPSGDLTARVPYAGMRPVESVGGRAVTFETAKKLGVTVRGAVLPDLVLEQPRGQCRHVRRLRRRVGGFFSAVIDKGAAFVKGLRRLSRRRRWRQDLVRRPRSTSTRSSQTVTAHSAVAPATWTATSTAGTPLKYWM